MRRDTYDDFRHPELSWAVFAPAIDWQGKTVLDVGCHAGWCLFAAQKAGAKHLTGIDLNGFHNTKHHPEYQKPFDRIRERTNEFQLIEGDWMTLQNRPTADIVLCMNALHYMNDPHLAQRFLFNAAQEVVVLETSGLEIAMKPWKCVLRAPSHWNSRQIRVYRRSC